MLIQVSDCQYKIHMLVQVSVVSQMFIDWKSPLKCKEFIYHVQISLPDADDQ